MKHKRSMKQIKCLVMGDRGVGKTCMLNSSIKNAIPGQYIQETCFYNYYSSEVMFENAAINLQMYDKEIDKDYDKIEPILFQGTDVFIFCFSLISPTSLLYIEGTLVHNIKKLCPNTPYILIGLKSDLRDECLQKTDEFKSNGWEPIPYSKGEEIRNKIGAQYYVECSALKQFHLKEVFEAAIKADFHSCKHKDSDSKDSKCNIM